MTLKTLVHIGSTVTIGLAPGTKAGVLEVINTGPLSTEIYCQFRPFVLRAIKDAPAIVARLDRAIDALVGPPPVDEGIYSATNSPPQAVVVREASFELWVKHAQSLASLGVRRSVFLPQQANYAYQWAELYASLSDRLREQDCLPTSPAPLL